MSHILAPSKYKENYYQSLTGVNYQLVSAKQQLIRKEIDNNATIVYTITLKDTCFTSSGKAFNRFIVDSILDDRFFPKREIKLSHSYESDLPIEPSLHSIQEFIIFLS